MSLLDLLKKRTIPARWRPKILSLFLSLVFLLTLLLAYRESWFDPFTTLDVPDRLLKPHAVTEIAYIPNEDPTKTMVLTEYASVQEFMHALSLATLARQTSQDSPATLHFVLHRGASRFHKAEDFALEFDPQKGMVYFAGQSFQLSEAGQLYLTKVPNLMRPGWIN